MMKIMHDSMDMKESEEQAFEKRLARIAAFRETFQQSGFSPEESELAAKAVAKSRSREEGVAGLKEILRKNLAEILSAPITVGKNKYQQLLDEASSRSLGLVVQD